MLLNRESAARTGAAAIGTRAVASDPRIKILTALLALAVVGSAIMEIRLWLIPSYVPDDFSPFYCGGKVVLARQDPYRVEPLRSCEANLGKAPAANEERDPYFFVTPAPLPGYDFVPLALLGRLPFLAAKVIFVSLVICATLITGVCLAKMSPLPLVPAVSLAYFAAGLPSLHLGQLPIITISLIAVAALALRSERTVLAVCALIGALIQPQIAAFPLVATFVFLPAARLPIALLLSALIFGSLAALGIGGSLEYVRVLPLQSLAEVLYHGQYSFSGFLATIGVRPGFALALSTAQYLAMFAMVIAILSRNAQYAAKSGALVLIPAIFAVLGGSYLHFTQVAVAIVAAAAYIRPSKPWFVQSMALAALVIPFNAIPGIVQRRDLLIFVVALACAWLWVFFVSDPFFERRRATIVTLVLALYIVLMVAMRPPVNYAVKDTEPKTYDTHSLASAEWLRYFNLYDSANVTPRYRVYSLLLRLPTWVALIIFCVFSSVAFLRASRQYGVVTDGPARRILTSPAPV